MEEAADLATNPRYTLINEPTYLAWIRTSITIMAGGAGLAALAHPVMNDAARTGVSVSLLALGSTIALIGYQGWREVQRAIDEGASTHPMRVAPYLSLVLGVVGIVVMITVLVSR